MWKYLCTPSSASAPPLPPLVITKHYIEEGVPFIVLLLASSVILENNFIDSWFSYLQYEEDNAYFAELW